MKIKLTVVICLILAAISMGASPKRSTDAYMLFAATNSATRVFVDIDMPENLSTSPRRLQVYAGSNMPIITETFSTVQWLSPTYGWVVGRPASPSWYSVANVVMLKFPDGWKVRVTINNNSGTEIYNSGLIVPNLAYFKAPGESPTAP